MSHLGIKNGNASNRKVAGSIPFWTHVIMVVALEQGLYPILFSTGSTQETCT